MVKLQKKKKKTIQTNTTMKGNKISTLFSSGFAANEQEAGRVGVYKYDK